MTNQEIDELWEAWVNEGSTTADCHALARILIEKLCNGAEGTGLHLLRLDSTRESLSERLAEGLSSYPDIVAGWRALLGDHEDLLTFIRRVRPDLLPPNEEEEENEHPTIPVPTE